MSWLERARTELAQAKQGSANANARPAFGSFDRRRGPYFSLFSTDSTPFFEEAAQLPPAETAQSQCGDIADIAQLPAAKTDEALPSIPAWRQCALEFVPQSAIGEKLRTASLAFLDSDLASHAAALGWNEAELFGVFDHADPAVIDRRAAAKGLVVFIALAPWPDTRIEALYASHAVIVTGRGGRFASLKRLTTPSLAFWKTGVL